MEVHENHVVIVMPTREGECSFFAGDYETAPFFGLMERQCGQPVEYIATGRDGHEAGLCVLHGAHVRACPTCSAHLSRLRNSQPRPPEPPPAWSPA